METPERILKYIKKHNCEIIKKWNCGIPQYRVYKDGLEKKYPTISEELFSNIRNQLERVSEYNIPESGIYKLKEN